MPPCPTRHGVALSATFGVVLLVLIAPERGLLRPPIAGAAVAPPVALPRFVRYVPSAFEAEWAANVGDWFERECAVLASPAHAGRTREWLALATASQVAAVGGGAPSHAAADGVLSHFEYALADGEVLRVRIEPLAGILRDPRSVCPQLLDRSVDLQSKDFLFVAPVPPALLTPAGHCRRVVVFDLGSTRYSDPRMPGLRWIYEALLQLGLPPTDVYAWEVLPTPGAAFYEGMPSDLARVTHFFNFKATVVGGAGTVGAPPLDILRDLDTSDFVVFKLDIDYTPTELEFVDAILAAPALAARIDVFFWEHHVDILDMRPHWGVGVELLTRLNSSYDYYTRLRQAGILAHAWP